MIISSISSGSSGNCIYIGSENTHLLVDMGISGKKIEEGLNYFEKSAADICGILITHEHSDHVKGIGSFVKKYKVPVYGTIETLAAVKHQAYGKSIPVDLMIYIKPGDEFDIGDITVNVTKTSHDAANSVCYRFTNNNRSIAMATDLGKYDDEILNHLSGADVLYLESNYDPEMLMVGTYPYYLKLRIDGEKGHLSNELSAKLISEVLSPKLQSIILAHLSKDNNYPEIAYMTHKNMLDEKWIYDKAQPELFVAKRDVPSVTYTIHD